MTVHIELADTGYPSGAEPLKASGFLLTLGEYGSGGTQVRARLTFEEGLSLLKELGDAAALYRNALTARLDVTSRLASIDSLLEVRE